MWPLPDTGELYAIADRIRAHSNQARHRADLLAHYVSDLQWRGLAADAFTPLASGLVAGLRSAAAGLDDAAAVLLRHAQSVDDVKRDIGQLRDALLDVGIDVLDLLDAGLLAPQDLLDGGLDLLRDGGNLITRGAGLVGDLLGLG